VVVQLYRKKHVLKILQRISCFLEDQHLQFRQDHMYRSGVTQYDQSYLQILLFADPTHPILASQGPL